MLNIVQDHVKTLLPAKRKSSPGGWISFNAPCCVHNGETADKRNRGGLMANADGSVSYHCFNCNYKTSYTPGRPLTYKFRKFLGWMGASDQEVKRLVIEAIRIKDLVNPEEVKLAEEEKIEFKRRPLPDNVLSFQQLLTFHLLDDFKNVPPLLNAAADYVKKDRKIDVDKYDFYWTDSAEHSLHQRVIIPIYWEGSVAGYTSRAFVDGVKPKYYSSYEPNMVFNLNMQKHINKFVIVCEGPFDAMSIDGVAIMGSEISEVQADLIDSLGKEVIVVPDFDFDGKRWSGESMVKAAQKYGWSVSFPVWMDTCKDVNEAVVKYGKLFVLKSILDAKESSKLKIELLKKRIHN